MKNGLEFNKIAAAVLLAGIVAMVAGIGAEKIYNAGEGHGHAEAKRGYTVPGAESADAGADAVNTAPAAPVDIMPLMAKADVAAGEALSKRCTSCHTFDKGGKNGVGPNQWGLVGSHVGHAPGFAYSDALKNLNKTWDFQNLSDFLQNPKAFAPGNKMAFAGMKKAEDRANLIAWINQQSDKPLPVK